ncbi:tubulin polyglutamylase TTLL4 isoform X2 [Teleopsis dalmanni]|uniref:tubulin polyglutamylase TTLL4 isoform X2 n=1 Tax=Teleopsis dalmanni TaxID=139649 RepID=UPI0018CF8E47|nr:tubulin polyglutamylase TTLL4 isoform X2 [Teleopsis dalmanni]
MAPIIDKRPQNQIQPNEIDQAQSHVHDRENSNIPSNKGLEILDFHESWLEEMEIYKEKLHQRKQLNPDRPLRPHIQPHLAQNGLLLPNSINANNATRHMNNNIKGYNNSSNQGNESNAGTINKNIYGSIEMPVSFLKRKGTENMAPKATVTEAKNENTQSKNRTREEKTHSSHSKRHGNSRLNSNIHPTHNQNTAKSGIPNISSYSNGNSTNKAASKIIVNQFHASSFLSTHQHDEKTKILAQNGLTKSAASAYETSLYASNYLPRLSRTKHGGISCIRRLPNVENINYVGVSLAKIIEKHQKKESSPSDDEPYGDLDELNESTETDSDDEYSGQPFFLCDDGNETHQSRNIRDHTPTDISSCTNEEERSEYYRPSAILTPSIFPNVPPYLNFSSHVEKGPPIPDTLHKILKWKFSPVMPKIVKRIVINSGFRIIKNTTDWMAVWEKHMKSPGFRTIRSHQKYNHMPGSFRIGRKDSMWRNLLNNMKKFGTKEFGFMQRTYIMPGDLESLRQVWPKTASKLTKWIVKPPASARGTGIRIVNKWSQFPKDRPLVVQKYIERPLLINDNKFDMRIYVVVTSINPLRIYIHKDGLARFASVKYRPELECLDDRCMHLTNYSINKFSQNYSKNEDFNACQGHKWTLQSLWSYLEAKGINTKRLWATLRNLVIKSIISGESGLNRMYRQNVNFRYNCFELFGFDILLDENLIPWLLEINISPSLHSELPLDLHVKGPLIQALLNTALYQVPPKLGEKQQNEILETLNLEGPLCYDKRIFTTCLTAEEVRKHNQFTNRSIEYREDYIDSILENLLPDDVRCLLIAEDEYARSKPLERIFPTQNTYTYLKFIDNPRYYNRLLDAWEHRYADCRQDGIALLSRLCEQDYHLQVSDAALEKEPNVTLTDIDMLHARKSETLNTMLAVSNKIDDTLLCSKVLLPSDYKIEKLVSPKVTITKSQDKDFIFKHHKETSRPKHPLHATPTLIKS